MGIEKRVIRLEPEGPAAVGLSKMALDPADFQSELPEQRVHVYFEDADLGLSIGVWTTTSMQEAFGPYPGDEFMGLLEGQVVMVDGDDNGTTVRQGDFFCIRNAIPISWKQVGCLRKFYMTYNNPRVPPPDIVSTAGGVTVLDKAALEAGLSKMTTTDPFEIVGDLPLQRDVNHFTNDAGNMFVGMWDSTPFESELRPFPCHELVQVLEGGVTVTEGDGAVHAFGAGDVFFVPMGTVCSWRVTDYIKKYYGMLDPSGAPDVSS